MQIELERRREREDHGLAADQARWGRDQNKVLALPLLSSRLQYLFSLFLDCPLGIQGNVQHQSFLFIKKPAKVMAVWNEKGVA